MGNLIKSLALVGSLAALAVGCDYNGFADERVRVNRSTNYDFEGCYDDRNYVKITIDQTRLDNGEKLKTITGTISCDPFRTDKPVRLSDMF